jgi:hypothetical protein
VAEGTTTTTLGRLGLEQATLEFTACMRDQGIDTPDIRLDAQGRPVLDGLIESVDTTSGAFRAALAECASILTRAGALDLRTDPELQAVIVDQLQEFSECARREGLLRSRFPEGSGGVSGTARQPDCERGMRRLALLVGVLVIGAAAVGVVASQAASDDAEVTESE